MLASTVKILRRADILTCIAWYVRKFKMAQPVLKHLKLWSEGNEA
jgi:hypothetical protein